MTTKSLITGLTIVGGSLAMGYYKAKQWEHYCEAHQDDSYPKILVNYIGACVDSFATGAALCLGILTMSSGTGKK